MRRLISVLAMATIALGAVGPVGVSAKPPAGNEPRMLGDNLSSPAAEKQQALKQAAQEAVLTGEATAKAIVAANNKMGAQGGPKPGEGPS